MKQEQLRISREILSEILTEAIQVRIHDICYQSEDLGKLPNNVERHY
jgi:hypothetical protein